MNIDYREDKPRELIEIKGMLKSHFKEKIDRNGKNYYFSFIDKDGQDKGKPIFFFKPSSELIVKIDQLNNELGMDQNDINKKIIHCKGYDNGEVFTAVELIGWQ